jgi:hypothetical protein
MHHDERFIGLSLETLACLTAIDGDGDTASRLDQFVRVPPSVVCTSIQSKQFELDQWFPANPIGSGENWPLEAQINNGFSRRMPIGLLWDLARREQYWQIDEATAVEPMHAIAIAARDALRPFSSIDSVGLVVPNWLKQGQQQLLLDSLSGSGLKWRLIWRPIAAATYWIQHYFEGLRLDYPTRTQIGQILCLHLGLFECEWTIVELVAEPIEGVVSVLPARRRAFARGKGLQLEHQPGILSDVLVAIAKASADKDQSKGTAWRQMWSTPWLLQQLSSWCGNKTKTNRIDCPPAYCPGTVQFQESSSNAEADCGGIRWPTISIGNAKSWAQRILKELSSANSQLDGAVVCGELASVIVGESRLAEQFLKSNIDPDTVLIVNDSTPHNLLAIGAQEQCRRIANGVPSYLTKLPLLRTVVSRAGEPEWISLLAEGDPYVYGGQKWARPEPVRGIKIPRSHILRLAIDHEDFDTVREASIAIPELYQANQPSEIYVTITPAQGNARVEIRPLGEHKPNKQLLADLSRMDEVHDEQKRALDPEEYIDWVPRVAPPLLPRLGNLQRWRNVLRDIKAVVHQPFSAWPISSLRNIRTLLRDKVAAYYPRNCTAVGSDGTVELGHEYLLLLGDGCVELLRSRGDIRDVALRCLAYLSYDSPILAQYIRENLLGKAYLDDAEHRLIGNCLRDTVDIGVFLSSLAANRRRSYSLNSDQIRTIAEISCYRANAFEHVKSSELTQLYQSIAVEFENDSSQSNLQLHFRYLTLCTAFLLRRRIFDDSFIDPEGELAVTVKASCERVIDRAKRGGVYIMGGAVDVPAVMRQLIKYVDRQGRGSFVIASG